GRSSPPATARGSPRSSRAGSPAARCAPGRRTTWRSRTGRTGRSRSLPALLHEVPDELLRVGFADAVDVVEDRVDGGRVDLGLRLHGGGGVVLREIRPIAAVPVGLFAAARHRPAFRQSGISLVTARTRRRPGAAR